MIKHMDIQSIVTNIRETILSQLAGWATCDRLCNARHAAGGVLAAIAAALMFAAQRGLTPTVAVVAAVGAAWLAIGA
jgi:hypothetical protein